jgi:hypothetical protein
VRVGPRQQRAFHGGLGQGVVMEHVRRPTQARHHAGKALGRAAAGQGFAGLGFARGR